ncbi:hypothetical protein [Exiguobacterium sp. s133]|uniref:hypothetical protein n=1 Tax=Exiguobacterium sp. s133 TaxID=2751213 RepID=UPI001BE70692|nr:hypothetical protein [Exiguobacterium sp. s133]
MKIPTASDMYKYSQEKRSFDIRYKEKDIYILEKISVINGLLANAREYKQEWYANKFSYPHPISELCRGFPEIGRQLAEEAKVKGYSVSFNTKDAYIIGLTYKDFN